MILAITLTFTVLLALMIYVMLCWTVVPRLKSIQDIPILYPFYKGYWQGVIFMHILFGGILSVIWLSTHGYIDLLI